MSETLEVWVGLAFWVIVLALTVYASLRLVRVVRGTTPRSNSSKPSRTKIIILGLIAVGVAAAFARMAPQAITSLLALVCLLIAADRIKKDM